MKINNLGQINKVINLYGKNNNMKNNINEEKRVKDKIEISSAGKTLSSLELDDFNLDNDKKIEALRNAIKNGTYKVDTEKLSKAMIDNIKGNRI